MTTPPASTVTLSTKERVDSKGKDGTIPVMIICLLTAIIITVLVFIVLLLLCCRRQRRNLKKKYVEEYQPQNAFLPHASQVSAHNEMQKFYQPNEPQTRPVSTPRGSLHTCGNSFENRNDSKRVPSSSGEVYLVNSRTSIQTTLYRPCPRETLFDYKGSAQHSLPHRTIPALGHQHTPETGTLAMGTN